MSSASRWGLALLMFVSACASVRERREDTGADVGTDAAPTPDTTDAWTTDAGPCADRDEDDVCDAVDVCPDVADPAQIDVDGDGVGWLCDTVEELGFDTDGSEPLTAFRGDYFVALTRGEPAALAFIGPDYAVIEPNFGNTVRWANRVDVVALDAEGRAYFFVRGTPGGALAAILRMSRTGLETLPLDAFSANTGWRTVEGPGARFIAGENRAGVQQVFGVDAMEERFSFWAYGVETDLTDPSFSYVWRSPGDVFAVTDRIAQVVFPTASPSRRLWGGSIGWPRGAVFACTDTGPFLLRGLEPLALGLSRGCGEVVAARSDGYIARRDGELVDFGIGTERTLSAIVGTASDPLPPWFATPTGVSRLEGRELVSYWEAEPGSGPFQASGAREVVAVRQRVDDTQPWSLHVRGARNYDTTIAPEFSFRQVNDLGEVHLARGRDQFITSGGAPRAIERRDSILRGRYAYTSSFPPGVLMDDRWVALDIDVSAAVGSEWSTGQNAELCSLYRIDGRPEFGPRVDVVSVAQPCRAYPVLDPFSDRDRREFVVRLEGAEMVVALLRLDRESEAFTLSAPVAPRLNYLSFRAAVDRNWTCELPGEARCWPHDDTSDFEVVAEGTETNQLNFILRSARGLAVLRHFGAAVPPPARRVITP